MRDMWGFFTLVDGGVSSCMGGSGELGAFDAPTGSGLGGFGRVMVPPSQSMVEFHSLSQL